jgi:chromosome segregation ATPase
MAITKEQIFRAADALSASGHNPTLAAVRRAVGGGSFTTISEVMNEWRAQKAAEAVPRDPMPQIITDKLHDLGNEVWAVALDLANRRLEAERKILESTRVEMEGALREAVELADQLSAELAEAETKRIAAVDTVKSEQKRIQLLAEKERNRLIDELAVVKAKLNSEYERVTKEAAHQAEYLAQMQAERDDARHEARQAREEAAILRGRLEGLEAALKANKL